MVSLIAGGLFLAIDIVCIHVQVQARALTLRTRCLQCATMLMHAMWSQD